MDLTASRNQNCRRESILGILSCRRFEGHRIRRGSADNL